MSGADSVSLGATSIEVDGADPQPSDDIGDLLRDLVMCGTGAGVPESTAQVTWSQPPGP
jgi:hypothetical protein